MNVAVTEPNQTAPDLSITLSSTISGGFGENQAPISISTPTLSGGVDLEKHVVVQVPVDGMPQLSADLVFKWSLPNVDASLPLGSWGSPTFSLNNVEVDLGSILGSLARPIAKDINAIVQPLQPVFDVLSQRIPGLSDISELLGGKQVTLISLDQTLQSLPAGLLPTDLTNALHSVVTLRNYADTINDLASAASGSLTLAASTSRVPMARPC